MQLEKHRKSPTSVVQGCRTENKMRICPSFSEIIKMTQCKRHKCLLVTLNLFSVIQTSIVPYRYSWALQNERIVSCLCKKD